MKATAVAPSNIAFIKYWGVRDDEIKLPANGSISMNLSNLLTTTTVEFDEKYSEDEFIIDGQKVTEKEKFKKHLDRVRKSAGINLCAKVISQNNFPSGTGLSSSASGFAALTVAASNAAGLKISEKELSIFARKGSGSACRSIPDGFVEWFAGDSDESSFAKTLFAPDHWDICDIVAVVSKDKKDVSSTEGHKLAQTSPFFHCRLKRIDKKIAECKKNLEERNFTAFGELLEAEALELHAIYLTSRPSLIYLLPESLLIINKVKQWRSDGIEVYFTLNTGQDIHLICQKKDGAKLSELLSGIPQVKNIITNLPSIGTRLTSDHLF